MAAPFLLALAGVWLLPAFAQDEAGADAQAPKNVDVSFDLGSYSTTLDDWTVETVIVKRDLDPAKDFTVMIQGDGDRTLWSATQPFTAPETRIAVGQPVAVGQVTKVGVSQDETLDPLLVTPQVVDPVQGGGGSSGQVATSMVLVIIIAVILFRTPLPAASTQRWTK